jgi:hypothetical protein
MCLIQCSDISEDQVDIDISLEDTISLDSVNNEAFIFLALGQSNAANQGQGNFEPAFEVYNLYQGRLYPAKSSIKGAFGDGASVWPLLGDRLIYNKYCKQVVILSIAQGGAALKDWIPGGKYSNKIDTAFSSLHNTSLKLDAILWHQGESDNLLNTDTEDYISMFEELRKNLRAYSKASIYIARASYYYGEESLVKESKGIDSSIINAQDQIILKYEDVKKGPNTDLLDKAYHRYDGIHFSILGLEEHAKMWYEAIISQQ